MSNELAMKRYLYLSLIMLLCWSCTNLSKIPKISTFEEYRQLDSLKGISGSIAWILTPSLPAGLDLYTDIDLILKNKKDKELRRSFIYHFIKRNKEHINIYRDILPDFNEVIWFTFMGKKIDNYFFSRQWSEIGKEFSDLFTIENKKHNLIEYDEGSNNLSNLRELLHKTIEEYRSNDLYVQDLTNRNDALFAKDSIKDYLYPNYIVLHYNPIQGMDIACYNDLKNVDFSNTYFRSLADLFSQMCKKYKLINIYATVPVLKYRD